jgi:hypothetical protein
MLAGAVLALATAIGFQALRDRSYFVERRDTERILYVQSGPVLQRLVLEFDALASDVYWIRAIQHFGGERRFRFRARNYDLLYPLLDLTTTLDPYFTIAYRFGAIFLSEPKPGGPARPDHAIALLKKGLTVQPDKWQYFHDIAFVHYWHLDDPTGAAIWFQRGADLPNAPSWLRPVAATMLSARDRSSARILWREILKSDQQWLKRTAERSLLQIDAMDQIDQLQDIVRKWPPPPGEVFTWHGLIRRKVLRDVPVDPADQPYELNPETGEVRLAEQSPLFPLPTLRRRL